MCHQPAITTSATEKNAFLSDCHDPPRSSGRLPVPLAGHAANQLACSARARPAMLRAVRAAARGVQALAAEAHARASVPARPRAVRGRSPTRAAASAPTRTPVPLLLPVRQRERRQRVLPALLQPLNARRSGRHFSLLLRAAQSVAVVCEIQYRWRQRGGGGVMTSRASSTIRTWQQLPAPASLLGTQM